MPRERVTEVKGIDIDHTCKENPVYLQWVGPKGGRNQWLFFKRQQIGLEVSNAKEFNSYVDDIETARGNAEYLSKDSAPRWIVGANQIPTAKIRGLKTMLSAPKVEMLMNPDTWSEDGPVWQTVKVLPGSFPIENTGDMYHSIEFTIEFSHLYTQGQ